MRFSPEYIPVIDQTISKLEHDVKRAPLLSRADKSQLYTSWKKHEFLHPILREDFIEVREPYASAIEMLAVGVVGLGRLYYQDLTTWFQPWNLLKNETHNQQQRDISKLEALEESLLDFPLYSLPPWTIERQAMDWFGEIGQLMIETQIKVGNFERALELLTSIEISTQDRLAKIEPFDANSQMSDQTLDAYYPDVFRSRQQYKGNVASQAMLVIRRAQIENTFSSWQKAFTFLRKNHRLLPEQDMYQLARFERAKSTFMHAHTYTFGQKMAIFLKAPRTWLDLYFRTYGQYPENPTVSV